MDQLTWSFGDLLQLTATNPRTAGEWVPTAHGVNAGDGTHHPVGLYGAGAAHLSLITLKHIPS